MAKRTMSSSPQAMLKKLISLMIADEQTMAGLSPTELEVVFRKLSEGQRERLLEAARGLSSTIAAGARPDLVEALDELDDVREIVERESRVVLAKKPKAGTEDGPSTPAEKSAIEKITNPKGKKAAKAAAAVLAAEPTAPPQTSPPVEPAPAAPTAPAAAPDGAPSSNVPPTAAGEKKVLFDTESLTNKPLSKTEDRQLRAELDRLKNEIVSEKGMESLTPEGKAIWREAKTTRAETVAKKLGIPLKAEHFLRPAEPPTSAPSAPAPPVSAPPVVARTVKELMGTAIPKEAAAFDELLAELAGAGKVKEAKTLQNFAASLGEEATAKFGKVEDALKGISQGRTTPPNIVSRTAKSLLTFAGSETLKESLGVPKSFKTARELATKAAAGVEGMEAFGGIKAAIKATGRGMLSAKVALPMIFMGLAAKSFMGERTVINEMKATGRVPGDERFKSLDEVTRKLEMDRLVMGRRQALENSPALMQDVVRVLSGQSLDKGLTKTEVQIGNVMEGRSPADTQKLLDVLLGRLATYDKKTGERTPIENPLAPDF